MCINEQPDFLNFDHCKLSYEENTCVKEYKGGAGVVDVNLVITFNDETLAQLHNVTRASIAEANETAGTPAVDNSRYIYVVDGLRYDASNTDGTVDILPCMGDNPTSRWRPRSDISSGECINTLQSDTVAVFRRHLETSNDENPFLRDLYLWNDVEGDGCNELDEMAYGMLIWTNEGCFENVHPDFM